MAGSKRAETCKYASIESNTYRSVLEGKGRTLRRALAWLSGCMLALSIISPAFAAHYPIHKLHTMVSQPGQGKVAFLVDVAKWMRSWTDETGFEACAMIAKGGNRYGVVIDTFDSRFGCRIDNRDIPDGMTSTGQTIHSHPRASGGYTTARDDIVLHMAPGTKYWINASSYDANHFSKRDYHSKLPGYLVGTKGIYFQNGPGTQRLVTPLNNG